MKCEINFFCEQIVYTIRNKRKLRKWVISVLEDEGKKAGNLNFIFCDDAFLSDLNFKYLKHKTLTDILTFSYSDNKGQVDGDIFISLPRIKENAKMYNQQIEVELHRVMVHGILHLSGYSDTTPSEKIEMRKKENYYLEIFFMLAPPA